MLWFRQVQVISNEGGIALKHFNVRVTYVNALQVSSSDLNSTQDFTALSLLTLPIRRSSFGLRL